MDYEPYYEKEEDDEEQRGKAEGQERMEISDYELASLRHQRDNKLNVEKSSAWLNSSCEQNVQTDGHKVMGQKRTPNKKMSEQEARWQTFREFPWNHNSLIKKLSKSGFYYTGKSDSTVCFQCAVEIDKWEETDDPNVYHEPDCPFHIPTTEKGIKEEDMLKDIPTGDFNSLEGSSHSILDAPITGSSTIAVPTPLTPQPAELPTSSKLAPSNQSIERFQQKNTNVENVKELDPLYQKPEKLTPANLESSGATSSIPEKTGEKPADNKKQFVTKAYRPSIEISTVLLKEHEDLLRNLNLHSEEDRRKSFTVNDIWYHNTNNVVDHQDLAKDGFFYLGNLDRTQCFSCGKVFITWQRNDVVNKVHMECVPYCRMAKGEETSNQPIPIWQSLSQHSSYSSLGRIPSTELHYPQQESSFEGKEVHIPSHQAQVVKLPDVNQPHYVKSNIPAAEPMETSFMGSHPKTSKISHPTSLQVPLDLTQYKHSSSTPPKTPKSPILISEEQRHSSLPQRAPVSNLEEANIKSVPVNPPKVKLEEMRGVQPTDKEEPHPAISIQTASVNPPVEPSPSAGATNPPVEPSPSAGASNIPAASKSWHMGQTTLYNTPSPMPTTSLTEPTVPSPIASTVPLVNTNESPWRDIFPCNDPARPDLRSSVARQETFDYHWPASNISTPIDEFAKAGFYHMGDNDHVKCWYCGGGVLQWNVDDNPWEEHARLYPTCEFLLQQKGPEYVSNISARHRGESPVQSGPVRQQPPPPHFQQHPFETSSGPSSSEESSYGSVHAPFTIPSPSGGSPHATIIGTHNQQFQFPFRSSGPTRVVDPREELARHRRLFEDAINSEAVLAATEMGFDLRTIRKVIKRKIRSSDVAFATTQGLLDAVLAAPVSNSPESSESEGEEPSQSSIPTSSTRTGEGTATTATTSGSIPTQAQGGGDQNPSSSQKGTENLDPKQLDKKLREYELEKRCKVCLDRDAQVVFVPCGHLCTCVECAKALRNCPLCRKRIQKAMRTYTS